MGTRPARGRGFLPEELRAGAPKVALVSARFWERWRGTRPLAGESIVIAGVQHAVVGIMPAGLRLPQPGRGVDAARAGPARRHRGPPTTSASSRRLRPDVDVEAARGRAEPACRGRSRCATATRRGCRTPWPCRSCDVAVRRRPAGPAPALRGVAAAAARRLHQRLEPAGGAGRRRAGASSRCSSRSARRPAGITRQWLAETLGRRRLRRRHRHRAWPRSPCASSSRSARRSAPRLDEVAIDWASIAFAGAAAVAAALVLEPAHRVGHAQRADRRRAVRQQRAPDPAAARQMRGREALIVAQVALTMVLLAGAGLLARSFAHAMAVDPGFRVSDDLVLVGLDRADRRRRRRAPRRAAGRAAGARPGRCRASARAGLDQRISARARASSPTACSSR